MQNQCIRFIKPSYVHWIPLFRPHTAWRVDIHLYTPQKWSKLYTTRHTRQLTPHPNVSSYCIHGEYVTHHHHHHNNNGVGQAIVLGFALVVAWWTSCGVRTHQRSTTYIFMLYLCLWLGELWTVCHASEN